MRTKVVTATLMAVAALYWVQSTAGQVQPVPTFGSGTVTVQGEVDVRRMPVIDVGQRGDWRVSLANAPDVRVVNMPAVAMAPLPFLRVGGRYVVTWPAGDQETIAVTQLGGGGWVRATGGGQPRWVNLGWARVVGEVP